MKRKPRNECEECGMVFPTSEGFRKSEAAREAKLEAFRKLIYEPEHTSTTCWCEPTFKNEGGTLHIVHNEQRDTLTKFLQENF